MQASFFCLSLFSISLSQTCWFPDGATIATDLPYHNYTDSAPFSSCCGLQEDGSRAYYLSNGQCWSNMRIRGSCTDSTWQSDECEKYCLSKPPLKRSASVCSFSYRSHRSHCTSVYASIGAETVGQAIVPCSDSSWGCSYNNCNASTFPLALGELELNPLQQAHLGISDGSVVTRTVTASISSTAATITITTMIPAPSTTPTVAGVGVTPMSPLNYTAAIVGSCIGGPFAVILGVAIALLLRERRKRDRNLGEHSYNSSAVNGGRPYNLPYVPVTLAFQQQE